MEFRKLSLALVVMLIILPKPISGRDAVLVLKSNTTYRCNGLFDDCRIGVELESELDFLMMDSTSVIRILQQAKTNGHITSNTKNPKKPVVQKGCVPYAKCIAKSNKTPGNNCSGHSDYCR